LKSDGVNSGAIGRCASCEAAAVEISFAQVFGEWRRGSIMTRFSTALAISICWLLVIAVPAIAQSEQGRDPAESTCFPWQEFKAGSCVAKSTPPAPPPPVLPCTGGSNDASGQCVCPANTHLDAAIGSCFANIVTTTRKATDSVVCSLNEARCTCPAGFNLLPANGNVAGSGTCVRSDVQNCLGGDLTVAGTCFCNGRVTMSGETYALELVGGKCVPKRCPLYTYLKEGKCIETGDKASVSPAGPATSRMKPIPAPPRPVCTACPIRPSAHQARNAAMAPVRNHPLSPSIASKANACAGIPMRIG
jgi:hypothetical protein